MSSYPFEPEEIFVSKESQEDLLTKKVLSFFQKTPVTIVTQTSDPLVAAAGDDNRSLAAKLFSLGKKRLFLTRYHGQWLKPCPGTPQHVCCNLWVLNPAEGCPADCTYCYLQDYLLANPTLKLFTNTADMLSAIAAKTKQDSTRRFRICTGELTDSLVWDPLINLSGELVPFCAKLPNVILELKTKTAAIDQLLEIEPESRSRTVVSWTVNARQIAEQEELYTANIDQRIEAARKVALSGYQVGFHFDPLIFFPGWEEAYRQVVAAIFKRLKAENIAWISIAALRYRRPMQQTMMERFPQSKVPFGEQFLASDNKLRYIQPLRFKMLKFLWRELKNISSTLPVYMCMESRAAWRNIAGHPPSCGAELVDLFSRSGKSVTGRK